MVPGVYESITVHIVSDTVAIDIDGFGARAPLQIAKCYGIVQRQDDVLNSLIEQGGDDGYIKEYAVFIGVFPKLHACIPIQAGRIEVFQVIGGKIGSPERDGDTGQLDDITAEVGIDLRVCRTDNIKAEHSDPITIDICFLCEQPELGVIMGPLTYMGIVTRNYMAGIARIGLG